MSTPAIRRLKSSSWQLDQVGGRRMPFEFEGVGEEEALEVLRTAAAVPRRVQVAGFDARLLVAASHPFFLRQLGASASGRSPRGSSIVIVFSTDRRRR